MAVAFSGVRRSEEVTEFARGDAHFGDETGIARFKIKRQESAHFGVGQMAHLVTMDLRGVACPAEPLSGWLWLRGWLRRHRDHAGRLSGAEEGRPLFVGLARAKFGLGMAPRITASWKKVLEGCVLFPRRGGARM